MSQRLRNIVIFLAGMGLSALLFISGFEVLHLKLEAMGVKDFCGFVYDGVDLLTGQRGAQATITHQVKMVYKVFAWPIKTIYVYFTDDGTNTFVVEDGRNGALVGSFQGWEAP